MTRRRVLAITAIRSEYFLQRPVFKAIMARPELELGVVVTGAHLSPLHNHTVRQVEADGFPIVERIESLIYSDHDAARIKGAASQLQVLAHVIDSRRPDWLLIPADREESITMALCGSYMGIAMAHYGAGDRVVGNVDDMIRHAVSRLSHVLLTSHEDARQRLISSGEEEWRVHNVGHSGLDRIRAVETIDKDQLARQLGVSKIDERYVVIIQHPLSSAMDQSGNHMRETLTAVAELDLQAFVSYPNSDPGSQRIIEAIEQYRSHPRFSIFRNIADGPFINLLRGATALLGNSSLGLQEAPYLRLAVLNIGARQKARHHSENVFFVPAEKDAIVKQVKALLEDRQLRERVDNCSNPFGDGHAGERIAELLATIPIDARLLNKDLTN